MQVALFTCLQIVRGHLALPVDAADHGNKVGACRRRRAAKKP
jgi:hypothetical protein